MGMGDTKEVRISHESHRESAGSPTVPSHTEKRKDSPNSYAHSSSEDGVSVHAEEYENVERDLSRVPTAALSRKNTAGMAVVTTTYTRDPGFEVDFGDDDPGDPKNYPLWYRGCCIFFVSFGALTAVLYSTSYTSGIPGLKVEFNIKSQTVAVLGITTYLIGMAVGSVILAPLSEMYGRRPIYLGAMFSFCILILPCGLAKSLSTILIVRFFGALAGSAMISNAPGTVSDIVPEEHRALAFSIWSLGPMNGPVVGPLVGGFVFQYMGWRWTNWVVMICAGVVFIMMCLMKETYAPAILRQRAAKRRKETGDPRWWSRYDEKKKLWPLLKMNLSRPFIMACTEPICIFWNIYIAVVYAILYLGFVAYPIVFSGLRHWSPGMTGLSYTGIGIGSLVAIVCEPLIRRMIAAHKPDPVTGKIPPEAMVSIVCIAAICIPVGQIIFAWTCTPNVHWIVPIIAGIPFGAGNCAVFIYASNYLVHSYGIYAASALAGNSVFRSVLGGTLPLAGPKMYETLGPNWAGTLVGLLELALVPIPFVFYKYGHVIRKKSVLISSMQADKEKLEKKKRKMEERAERQEKELVVSEKMEV